MSNFKTYTIGRTNPLLALIFFVLIMFGLFYLAKGFFTILSFAFPVMLIATVIINHKVLLGFGKFIIESLKTNPIIGIITIVFSIFAYPLVAAFLLFKAIATKEKKEKNSQDSPRQGEYIKYEEIEDDFLDISEIKKSEIEIENKYKDLF